MTFCTSVRVDKAKCTCKGWSDPADVLSIDLSAAFLDSTVLSRSSYLINLSYL